MLIPKRSFNIQTALVIGVAALLGAAWAAFNLYRAGGSSASGTTNQLVWTVFAIPFACFWGWLAARRREGWLAAFVCFCIYFFAIFIGARLELLLVGKDAASATGHALYFRLTPVLQLSACLAVAAQRSGSRGTMETSTEA